MQSKIAIFTLLLPWQSDFQLMEVGEVWQTSGLCLPKSLSWVQKCQVDGVDSGADILQRGPHPDFIAGVTKGAAPLKDTRNG